MEDFITSWPVTGFASLLGIITFAFNVAPRWLNKLFKIMKYTYTSYLPANAKATLRAKAFGHNRKFIRKVHNPAEINWQIAI